MYMFLQLLFAYSYAKFRATLCTNVSNMISNLIFKDIKTYYNILNYKIGMFYRTSFCMFVSKMWTRATFWTNDSSMISYSIFISINTYSTIINYETRIFCPNIFLHVHMQNVNSCKILHKWIKHDCIFNI